MAEGLTKALPVVGAVIDVGMNVAEIAKKNAEKNKFEQTKREVEEMISEYIKSVCDDAMNNEKYLEMFAPQLKEIENNLVMQKNVLEEQKVRKEQFIKWKKEAVDVDFILK